MNETDECKDDMKKFHKHGIDAMFADAVRGDGEAFHCHCAKHCAPRIARVTLDQLSCGVGIWTTQGFEYRHKQSNHAYERKTNGKGNCCKNVLKGLHCMVMRS